MMPPQTPLTPFSTPQLSAEIEREVMYMAVQEMSAKTVEQLPAENHMQFQHGKHWNYLVYEDCKPCEQVGEMKLVSSQIAIPIDRVVGQDAQMIPEVVQGISNSMANQMQSSVYAKMFEVAQKSGVVFEFPSTGLSLTQYMAIIAKCDCSVAEDGTISRPELLNIPPSLQIRLDHDLETAPDEFKQRLKALWQKKEQEAKARETARLARYDIEI
jgi:hypothetical protein